MTAANPLMMSRKELEIEIGSLRRQLDEKRVQILRERQERDEQYAAFQLKVGRQFKDLHSAVYNLHPDQHVELYACLEGLRRALDVL